MFEYDAAEQRVQTAVAMLQQDTKYTGTHPQRLRVSIDMAKADMRGLVNLLISKGVFTTDEWIDAVIASAKEEANDYKILTTTPTAAPQ